MPGEITAILTCIEGHAHETILLRAAQNKALKLGVPWIVISTHKELNLLPEEEREWVERTLKYAETAGATVVRMPGEAVEAAIISYLSTHRDNFDDTLYVLVGQIRRGFRSRRRHRMLKEALINLIPQGKVRLEMVSLTESTPSIAAPFYVPLFKDSSPKAVLEGLGYVFIATIICEILRLSLASSALALELNSISLIYLIATAVTSLRCGLAPALIAALIAFIIQGFFYAIPAYNLRIEDAADVVSMLTFLAAAVFIALMGSGTYTYILQAKERERFLQAVVNISGTLNRSFTRQEALQYLHGEMKSLLRLDVAYFLPSAINTNDIGVIYPADTVLSEQGRKALMHCWEEDLPAGYGTTVHGNVEWRFEVMVSASGFTGVLGVKVPNTYGFGDSRPLMLAVLADLSASILARIDRTQLLEESRVQEEREKLRTLLLSSVSHDLKTPLASIIGSLDIFHRLHDNLTPERRTALTQTAYQEAVRLDSFITNIIDMARLESGHLVTNREWADPLLLIRRIVRRSEAKLGSRRVQLDFPSYPIEAEIDPSLFDKAVSHILDNAAKYTPEGTVIHVTASLRGDRLMLSIADGGVGIPEGQEEAVFNKYTRLHKKDMQIAGTGLGLPIVRAIIQAHGGSIRVARSAQGGAMFLIELPDARELQIEREKETLAQ